MAASAGSAIHDPDRFVHAVIELISERGLANFTLADIGRAAGVSRGLASHSYASKDVLIRKALEHLLAPRSVQGAEGLQPLLVGAQRSFDNAVNGSKVARALHVVLGHVESNFAHRDLVTAFVDLQVAKIEAHLIAGAAAGEIRRSARISVQAQFVFATVCGTIRSFLATDLEADAATTREAMIDGLRAFLATHQAPIR